MTFLMHTPAVHAARYGEYRTKAAFIYNFVKYIDWPSSDGNSGSLIIAVLGEDPFDQYLDVLEGQSINGHPIIIMHYENLSTLQSAHVLYISDSEDEQLSDILQHVKNLPILTVSDFNECALQGGIIAFVSENNRVQFEVNVTAAKQAGILISSELLDLAAEIRE